MYHVQYEGWFGVFVTVTDAILYAHKLGKGATVKRVDKTPEGWETLTLVYEEF